MRQPLRRQLERLSSDRWAREGVRILLRSTWIGLSIWCLGLGIYLLFDWPIRIEVLGSIALACIAVGALLLVRRPMSPEVVARRLDKRFHLDEQLSTALEISANKASEGVASRLIEQSQRTMSRVRRYINTNQRLPWAELIAVLSLAMLSLGLLVLTGIRNLDVRLATAALPPLISPVNPEDEFPPEPFTPPPGTQGGDQSTPGDQGQPAPSSIDQAAIAALADALRDQSITRPAADALEQGDTAGAAQSLRELADQAERISETARNDLATSLREAAQQMEATSPDLADQLRNSAEGLRINDQASAQALEGLANAVEQLGQGQGQQGQDQQGQGAGQGNEQGAGQGSGVGNGLPSEQREQSQPSERLGVDGVPLELESEGTGDVSTDGEAQQATAPGGSAGQFERGGSTPDANRVQTGEDPLRIPADLRDVVQEYFSP
ncbi:MAG: hypothetical protein MI924_04900 [Chloroflexales bacterium]|nr:hypothetical protein [Chloroflexales bacterium]